jgi:hypothetical protein
MVLDLTISRISQMIRQITRRLERRFREQAKLVEAAVRTVSMFSAQSEKALEAARGIQLLAEPRTNQPPPPTKPEEVTPETHPELWLPPSAREPKPSNVVPIRQGPDGGYVHQVTKDNGTVAQRFEAAHADDLPDDSDRAVQPDIPAEDKNKPGSFESLMGLMGGMGASGLINP